MAADIDPRVVRLHVCNAGPDIQADLCKRILEPFASRNPGGTGVGLAILARIMTAHGGPAAMMVRPGWATCLALTFPRGDA